MKHNNSITVLKLRFFFKLVDFASTFNFFAVDERCYFLVVLYSQVTQWGRSLNKFKKRVKKSNQDFGKNLVCGT